MSGDSSFFDSIKPYLFGMVSGICATCVIQPLDIIKVRIQAINEDNSKGLAKKSTSPMAVGKDVVKTSGVSGLYKGLDAAVLRQVFYGTIRLGLYTQLSNDIQHKQKRNLTFFEKSYCSIISGLIGSIVGNPADLALIRIQVDTLLPEAQRRNYKGVGDAFTRMIKDEGVLALWRGSTPTVARATALTYGQLASFDTFKEMIEPYTGGPGAMMTRSVASFLAGIVASFVSLPFDNVKTKLMKMRPDASGVYPYKGFVDCFSQSIAREGFFGLWVGIGTYVIRVGPHSVVALIVLDYLNFKYGKKKSN